MTIDEAREVLDSITYKPGYYLRWDRPFTDGGIIRVWWDFERPDCYHPEQVGVGRSGDQLVDLANTSAEGLVRQVFGMTLRLEEHEAREWLLVEGQRVFDPHISLLGEGRYSAEQMELAGRR